ncbi:MAG: polynucleotide kinasephosphatase [Amycolatopsis sp.]|uniref:polynucleotide kinase-phosphatase n=1 Tax=Amycolatopsis sp. TaxID=37632 RepID=UPI002637749C|nr:polynucleotide kinase-phosphatase [Amycolatopsis sp.]MCU1687035.1 polynucleotide kinasephosphatase [Amycolatopsis sp.]
MKLTIPEMSLVALVGVSGSGKSTFARTHFAPTQVLSSDAFRGMVSDDENDQSATAEAFDALHYVAGKRLAAGRLTVVDATNVQRTSRAGIIRLAKEHDVLPTAIVLDLPERLCLARNENRPDRDFGPHVVRRQRGDLHRSLKSLQKEGFRRIHVLRTEQEVAEAEIVVEPLLNNRRELTGPFDVIGDVHGCREELEELLVALGYHLSGDGTGAHHPEGRTALFVGDLVDRGPDTPGVLRLVMGMAEAGDAMVVCGNHEQKLLRALRGKKVQVTHGLAESLEQLAAQGEEFRARVEAFCDGLIAHYVLDGGKLVVAHAGLPQRYQGRASGRVRSVALYGDTTGETDEYGLPVRYPWANDYRGSTTVLYGHTPMPDVEWINGTLCLDTGCVFGGKLTALRYPEREVVDVPAKKVWYEPTKPLRPAVQVRKPAVLELADVTGKRVIQTRFSGRIGVSAEQSAAALEVMSRFAMDPRWLLYLPPTMAPSATSQLDGYLEHPEQAFAEYRAAGVQTVVCEEKHMGSRAVVLVCKDDTVAPKRFGVDGPGAVYTRTGRPFFDQARNNELVRRVRTAATSAGLWAELDSEWLLFDTELVPWSAKAGMLIADQYASVGAAAEAMLPAAVDSLSAAEARGIDAAALLDRTRQRTSSVAAYRAAYRRYCWPTDGLDGVQLAPFQLLASERASQHERPHAWHLAIAGRLADADPVLIKLTATRTVDTTDADEVAAATQWWVDMTGEGGEGMVVKPAANLTKGARGLVQPGVKVRGREYLRIIYGPDYTTEENLTRLRTRNLNRKRGLAIREYALGLESLQRAAEGEPLWRVHECVFAVLAMESEPVDPRL